MRTYETIVVFRSELSDEQLKQEVEKVEKVLKEKGAQSLSVDLWGKKEIAYLVKKQRFGHFVVFNFETENASIVAEVTAWLRIFEPALKWQSHRLDNVTTRNIRGQKDAA